MDVRCGCGRAFSCLIDDVDALYDDFPFRAQNAADGAFFAFVFAGDHAD